MTRNPVTADSLVDQCKIQAHWAIQTLQLKRPCPTGLTVNKVVFGPMLTYGSSIVAQALAVSRLGSPCGREMTASPSISRGWSVSNLEWAAHLGSGVSPRPLAWENPPQCTLSLVGVGSSCHFPPYLAVECSLFPGQENLPTPPASSSLFPP